MLTLEKDEYTERYNVTRLYYGTSEKYVIKMWCDIDFYNGYTLIDFDRLCDIMCHYCIVDMVDSSEFSMSYPTYAEIIKLTIKAELIRFGYTERDFTMSDKVLFFYTESAAAKFIKEYLEPYTVMNTLRNKR